MKVADLREFQHTVTTADGLKLHVREYLSEESAPLRQLMFVHGACEHGGRYAEFAQAAVTAGWRVLVPDLRGHGLSEGFPVDVRRFEEYADDVKLLCRHFSLDPKRTAVVSHSMGGLVVAGLLESDRVPFAVACLLSPYLGLKIQVDRFTLLSGRILSYVWPRFRFKSRVKSSDLAADQGYLQERRKDTLIRKAVTARWFFAVRQMQRQVLAEAKRVMLPLLVLQGEVDPVTDPQATREWFAQVESDDRTLEFLPDHLHELLQEKDKMETTELVLSWLNEHIEL
jgi:lysophospholipase